MKHYVTLLFMIFISQLMSGQKQPESYDNLWAKVFKLETENLTKSALEVVAKIREKAEKEENSTQQIKTLLFTAKYTLILEEDAKLKVINTLKSAIAKTEAPIANVMESYLANLYWQYFKQNRYLFYNRTETEQKVDTLDFRTWDLTTLFKEVGIHFEKSLQQTDILKATKLVDFEDVLDYAPESDKYRPTLFDLLSHNALEFYKSSESNINTPLDTFKLTNSELFCDASQFAELQFPAPTAVALQLQAIKIYQDLIAFHLNDAQPEALVTIDLERLAYLHGNAILPDKEMHYLDNLKNAAERYKNQGVAALYYYEIAQVYQKLGNSYNPKTNETQRWKLKEALKVCDDVITAYPESRGAKKCGVLKNQLLRKDLELTVERYLPNNTLSKLLVRYRNLDALNFTAYKINKKGLEKLSELYERDKRLAYIRKLPKITDWNTPLIDQGDYQSHAIEVLLPPLSNGNYVILATQEHEDSTDPSYAYSTVQMTNLSLSQRRTDKNQLFQVVDRNNGRPIRNAKLAVNYRKNYRENTVTKTLTTDDNGFSAFPLNNTNYRVNSIRVTHGDETAFFGNTYINSKPRKQPDRITYQTFFFLDRSIYRPGQVVYFKGIVVERDGKQTLPATNELVTAVLRNTNDEKITELDFETNAYGSFSGKFVLPNGGLNGQYRLEVYGASNLINDSHYFSVEEYKRPKFQTSFEAVTESYQLNDSVTVIGKANSYAGSAISNAKVSYRVQRNVNYPGWFYWSRSYVYSEPQEIAHGTAVSKADGTYELTFKAVPDEAINKDNLPIFNYTIYADVTDINGETRSASTVVNVGYHSMEANLNIASKLGKNIKKHTLGIRTQNLNGQEIPAAGTLKMYKLLGPDAVLRPRPWPAPDYRNWDKETFRKHFPYEAYADELDSNRWPKGNLVWETTFDTAEETQIALPTLKKWVSGQYLIELETKDAFGQAVIAKTRTSVFSEKEKTLADNQLFDVRMDKTTYAIGDTVEVSFYSNAENIGVSYWVEKGNRIIKKGWIALKKGCESIQFPVTENDLGGFAINYSYTVYNAFQAGSLLVSVPYPNTDLEITTNTFRDKIAPGTEETWSFSIKGPKKEKVAAELLASMYDASLDQFRGHYWSFYPIQRPYYYYAVAQANANLSFGTERFNVYLQNQGIGSVPNLPQSALDWFGLSFGNAYWAQQQYLNKQRTKLRDTSSYLSSIPKGTVEGFVYDSFGQPLPGVSVTIRGTTRGTQTDFDGKFSIALKEGESLVFSYIGFTSSTLKVGSDNFYNVHLGEDSSQLDEVVVVGYGKKSKRESAITAAVSVVAEDVLEAEADLAYNLAGQAAGLPVPPPGAPENKQPESEADFEQVALRKNLQETAFFFPNLHTDKEGTVSFSFTSPEALTQWKLQLLAHTKDLKHGITSLNTVTQKELMILPNPPRFLREGDRITFSAKIANLSEKNLQGSGQLQLTDATTGKPLDAILVSDNKTQQFTVSSNGNTQLSWTLAIPEGLQAVSYKVVAKADNFSDGEQGFLPVLTNRTLVTETLPMWVRSNQTKTFILEKLRDNTSTSLRHHKLSLEITSNPAWYAVQALPYLMEYPYECNEQTFARYYANSLASYTANSNPRIQEVFEQWRNTDALLSNLEKNQELKSILIQETPWLRDAQSETEQKKRIALLFDLNLMRNQKQQSLRKLKTNQLSNGAWPWFKGGRANRHITQHIITGLGHLQKLTSEKSSGDTQRMIEKALRYLDTEFVKDYEYMKKHSTNLSKDHLSASQVQYLYMRSFFPEVKTTKKVDDVKAYYLGQAKKYWPKRSLYSQGLLALVLHRNAIPKTASKILKALRENSIVSKELGMYWKANTASWYWYQDPIATQSLLIEAFSEIDGDIAALDNLKVWLLKNKQTNQWKTTKATTAAIYALLLQGSDWLSVTDAVSVLVGGQPLGQQQLEAVKVEAGTGYFKTAWNGTAVLPKMAEVQLTKKGNGIAWGALYWQYFEDLDKITGAETPLQLKKELFLTSNTDAGQVLQKIEPNTKLKLGDLVRVRIELRADRDMEFVHMKDMRAAGLEPVNVLSQYKWQGGLGYYESTKDASTNFFFDFLGKGIYVFEYDLRVNNIGDFSNGITTIQSMYAPEFSSHSKGTRVFVAK